MCVRCSGVSEAAERTEGRAYDWRLWLRVALLIASAWLFSAADWAPAQNRHMLVVQLQDQACQSALEETAQRQPKRLLLARSAWLPLYTLSTPPVRSLPLEALWEESASLWAEGYFEAALQHSAQLLPLLHSHADFTHAANDARALNALAQLRIALLLLEARDDVAGEESDLLLSRHGAQLYCENSEFPEACALLRRRESLVPLYWSSRQADLVQLSRFANQSERWLSSVSQPSPDSILWESLVDGLPTHQWTRQGDCSSQSFWRDALTAWELELQAQRFPIAKEMRSRKLVRGTMWATVGVGAAFALAAFARSIQLDPRRQHLDSCVESPAVCPTIASVQASYDRWLSTKRQAAAYWVGAAISATAVIPLYRRSRPRRDAPHVTPPTEHSQWADETRAAATEQSALFNGPTPE